MRSETYNDLWRTLPRAEARRQRGRSRGRAAEDMRLNLPEENLLYFLEKNSLAPGAWQREIIRIVRIIAQYFYPQRQTKMMNEGCATFVHYTILNRLFDQGRINDGAMLEFLHSHSTVVFQPAFDDRAIPASTPMRSALR